ncbi:MAG: phosphatidate cytidylyltransferase [Clostridia bacterium]|nr:phosphatidate cytidylyltransferase [Clostridia bacterium]MDD4686286.1 phosphatidate cytidylyltransferase [Clostridia bacterium]
MKERFLTGLSIFFIVVIMFLTKIVIQVDWIFDIFIGIVAIIGALEFSKMLSKMKLFNHEILVGLFPVLLYVLILFGIKEQMQIYVFMLAVFALIFLLACVSILMSYIKKTDTINEMRVREIRTSVSKFSLHKAGHTLIGFVYPSLIFMMIIIFNHIEGLGFVFNVSAQGGLLSIIVLSITFLIPFCCDTFAYLTGSLIGGKKLCPKISQHKTISGAVGGVLWTAIILVVLFLIFNSDTALTPVFVSLGLSWWHIAILGIAGGIACVLGDLLASLMKRKASLKDSSTILPGHGGIVDRIDSFITTIPVVFIFLLFFII